MKQWIKLYTEALHDRKMRKLNRVTKSVFYDICLLAGQEDRDGLLPDLEDIALELDLKVTDCKKHVTELLTLGVLSKDNSGNLYVTKFKERQETNLTGAERIARYRNNKKSNADVTEERYTSNADDNADVTEKSYNSNEKVTVEIDIDKEKELNINSISGDIELNTRAKNPDPEKPKKPEKAKAEKHTYGAFRNVLLTDREVEALKARFLDFDERLENFSQRKAAKGYVYKSDYAAILSWADNDLKREAEKAKTQPEKKRTFSDIAAEFEAQAAAELPPSWDIEL